MLEAWQSKVDMMVYTANRVYSIGELVEHMCQVSLQYQRYMNVRVQ